MGMKYNIKVTILCLVLLYVCDVHGMELYGVISYKSDVT